MYTELLRIAVERDPQPDGTLTLGAALAVLLQRRNRLRAPKGQASSEISSALSDQLDYDTALITLARLLNIQTDIRSFDVPKIERARLELAIWEKGIQLDEVGATATENL